VILDGIKTKVKYFEMNGKIMNKICPIYPSGLYKCNLEV
jgi:hypothetical protein